MLEVWVVIDYSDISAAKHLQPLVFQLKKWGKPENIVITAVVLSETDEQPKGIDSVGVENVILVAGKAGMSDCAAAIAEMARDRKPAIISAVSEGNTNSLLNDIAARLRVPCLNDCIDADFSADQPVLVRPVMSGRAFARFRVTVTPIMASFRKNVIKDKHEIKQREVKVTRYYIVTDTAKQIFIMESSVPEKRQLDVSEGNIVITGGRIMENFGLLHNLTEAMGGSCAVGASRAAVDAGHANVEMQIGQTGKTVAPNVYIACGVSGATQHIVGVNGSRKIVAINNDENAPIFKYADFGIVGDVFQVVPALIKLFTGCDTQN